MVRRIVLAPGDAGERLDKIVVRELGLGRAAVGKLFGTGRVRVIDESGRRRRVAKGDVAAADTSLEVEVEADELERRAQPDPEAVLEVVLETAQVVVVDKPAGQKSAPLAGGERGTVANAILARYPEMAAIGFEPREPGLCHRLDTGTSGLLLAARTVAAFERLTAALREGRLDKRYLLVCADRGLDDEGEISLPLSGEGKRVRALEPGAVGRAAHTRYRVLSRARGLALCEATAPRAQRHQLRVHFAALGAPLVGDELYGGAPWPGLVGHALHASIIRWSGDEVVPPFEAKRDQPERLLALLR